MKRCYLACVYVLVVTVCAGTSQEWVGIDTQVSLYAPAFLQSQASAVYYSGRYTSPTGTILRSRKGYNTLHPDHTRSFDFAEIVIDRSTVQQSWVATLILDIFRAAKYALLSFLGEIRMPKGVWADPLIKHAFDHTRVNIGQGQDLDCLTHAYQSCVHDNDVVLYGFSRGAATICNFLCTRYTEQPKQRVKAAVLGGCFDSLESVFTQQAQRSYFLPVSWGKSVCNKLEWLLPSFGSQRVEPIDVIEHFPKNVPVLFISSERDAVVPNTCTKNLVNALVRAGHKHVYYLELRSGAHARHYLNNSKAQTLINTTVHAFYKAHGCAYSPELVGAGEALLQKIHCDASILANAEL